MAEFDTGENIWWRIRVPTEISPDGEIYVEAMRVKVVDGSLIIASIDEDYNDKSLPILVMAPGTWYFAVSVGDDGGESPTVDVSPLFPSVRKSKK